MPIIREFFRAHNDGDARSVKTDNLLPICSHVIDVVINHLAMSKDLLKSDKLLLLTMKSKIRIRINQIKWQKSLPNTKQHLIQRIDVEDISYDLIDLRDGSYITQYVDLAERSLKYVDSYLQWKIMYLLVFDLLTEFLNRTGPQSYRVNSDYTNALSTLRDMGNIMKDYRKIERYDVHRDVVIKSGMITIHYNLSFVTTHYLSPN